VYEVSAAGKDPATKVVSATILAEKPIGVPSLAEAASILKLPLDEIERASAKVTPWPTATASYWSLRQLARHVALARGLGKSKAPKLYTPTMSREDAEAAALLAETATMADVAAAAGCAVVTLRNAWTFYGIKVNRAA
jgi:hypothetical protein